MTKLTITTGSEQAFFKHGRRIARALDRGERLPAERVLRFDEPEEMMRLMTSARLAQTTDADLVSASVVSAPARSLTGARRPR